MPPSIRGGAVAIGNFDGVHRGHARLVGRLVERARQVGGPAIVFTFDPHPVRLLRPEQCPPPLTWTERKAELLARLGVDFVVAYPTDRELLSLSARAFFDLIVVERLAARAMVEGPNFYFGKGREGNIELLAQFAGDAGLALEIVEPAEIDAQMISSSRIRRLLSETGDAAAAAAMLTAPYRLRGIVTHGAGRGAGIGFPTANLEGIDTLMPAHGVYAGAALADDKAWPAAINVGPNPTFGESATKLEAHLMGCDRSLYGAPLELDFLRRLRDVRSFASADDLAEQVAKDTEAALGIGSDHLQSATHDTP
ncbi:MAG: riboflavin biosynthesis protein RibF [Planctomycetota bacterium]